MRDAMSRHHVPAEIRPASLSSIYGNEGQLTGVTLADGHELPIAFLFPFLGAEPCTDWIGSALATDEHGFLVSGRDLQLTHLDPARDGRGRPPLPLETSRPGGFAAGDLRSDRSSGAT